MKVEKPEGRGARAWEVDLMGGREALELLADYLRVSELEEQALSLGDPGLHEEYAVALRHLMLKYLAQGLEEASVDQS